MYCSNAKNSYYTCVYCNFDNCKYLTEDEKKKIYHLEEMKDEQRED